eukprot:15365183-Ditylum_brightwellii.AAC.1
MDAQHTNLYPDNKSGTLVSIGQLCNDGCRAIFEKEVCIVEKNSEPILMGPRNYRNGLWDIVLKPVTTQQKTKYTKQH